MFANEKSTVIEVDGKRVTPENSHWLKSRLAKLVLAHLAAGCAVIGSLYPAILFGTAIIVPPLMVVGPISNVLDPSHSDWILIGIILFGAWLGLAGVMAAWRATFNYFAHNLWADDKTERWPPSISGRAQIVLIMLLVFAGFGFLVAIAAAAFENPGSSATG